MILLALDVRESKARSLGGTLTLFTLFVSAFFSSMTLAQTNSSMPPDSLTAPKVRVDPVEEKFHGHTVSDPYRWLEDAESADTQEFVRAESAYTRSILDSLPGRGKIESRLKELLATGTISAPQVGGKFYFYTKREGAQNQPVLHVREGVDGKDRVLLDVNQLAADGTVALDWWFPAEDGKYVAYGTSASGSEESTLRLIETSSGKLLPDTIEGARFASVAWKHDSSGFYYARHPKKGSVPDGEEVYHVKIFYHALGSSDDPLIFDPEVFAGRHLPQDIPSVQLADDSDRWLLISVFQGWSKSELYLQDLKTGGAAVRVTEGKESLYSGEVFRDVLYITTNEAASRYKVFRAPALAPGREHWKELIPESDAVLNGVSVLGGRLLANYEMNASSRIKLFALDGEPHGEIELPAIGSVGGIGGKWDHEEAFFDFTSFTVPPSVYRVDLNSRRTSLWDSTHAPGVDPLDYEVKQLWFSSKDGTKVPMFVCHKKGIKLDGHNPTLLTGYGGFNVSLTPSFSASRYIWLEQGGVFAVANLRGGAEFGEDWHRAGMLAKKQNVFDDFIAAAEFLTSSGYTDKDHLAIQGGSNGGLLMGAMITQRPDLFRAVICQVPLLDMLRYQHFQIAKLWIPEYGSPDDPQQFDWLYAYSPYHHVKAGTLYPAILFMTADTDTRVDPMHAKKMAALLQSEAANGQSRERPILLRIESKAGHGAGKPAAKQAEEATDVYSFLFWQLGVKVQ